MAGLLTGLPGTAAVVISGTEPERLINRCAMRGVRLVSVQPHGEYELMLRIPLGQLSALKAEAERSQCDIVSCRREGISRLAGTAKRRFFPVMLMLFLLAMVFWSRAYIWDIEISGNETVPSGKILSVLRECGVDIGSCWLGFTSDSLRSQAIARLPELSWLTVNIRGSRAEVIVRERVKKPEMINDAYPCNIVASRDGFVTQVNALMGEADVSPGSAVLKGERLISGESVSITGKTRSLRAVGDVWAETCYEISAAAPETGRKIYTGEEKSRWALVIGGKRLNFYRNSSIYDSDCDKIYDEYKLRIGDLFSLPVKLVHETSRGYEIGESETDRGLLRRQMEQTLAARLPSAPADEVLSQSFTASAVNGGIIVCMRARCIENIARVSPISESDNTVSEDRDIQ